MFISEVIELIKSGIEVGNRFMTLNINQYVMLQLKHLFLM